MIAVDMAQKALQGRTMTRDFAEVVDCGLLVETWERKAKVYEPRISGNSAMEPPKVDMLAVCGGFSWQVSGLSTFKRQETFGGGRCGEGFREGMKMFQDQ